jgi:predicted patatin/cPLA2 family phospholipase
MRALVISGGGSKGAFAGGIAEFLIKSCSKKYDLIIGCSAGSLLAPLLSIREIEKAKHAFTSITQRDIFSVNPFQIRKNDGIHKVSINHFNTAFMFLRGKKTFGESNNLRNLIERTLTKGDFERIKTASAEVLVCASNLSCNNIEYFSSRATEYEDFCDWMWASANVVPFMSLLNKNGFEYADGGFGSRIPISEAINRGASDIDAIILSPKEDMVKNVPSRNAFDVLTRAFDFTLNRISKHDLLISQLEGINKEVNINFYFTPRVLTENSLIFEPEEMSAWWQEGYDYAKNNNPDCYCFEPSNGKSLLKEAQERFQKNHMM